MKALPPSPESKSEGQGDLAVSPEERHRATSSVRARRKANASLEQMGGTFKI